LDPIKKKGKGKPLYAGNKRNPREGQGEKGRKISEKRGEVEERKVLVVDARQKKKNCNLRKERKRGSAAFSLEWKR